MSTWWEKLAELHEEQTAVLELDTDESHLITGPAGSGKTNLLLLRAAFLYRNERPNIHVVVFTKSLRDFAALGAKKYGCPENKVVTCFKFLQNVPQEHGVAVPRLHGDFLAQRRALIDAVGRLITQRRLEPIYNCILLDEAQDYAPDEVKIFAALASTLFVVADSRQKIYDGDDPVGDLKGLIKSQRELKHHFRCGLQICRLADGIAKVAKDYASMADTSNYKEKGQRSTVEDVRCHDLDEQAARIVEKLRVQLRAYQDEFLGVMCPKNTDVEAIWASIQASPLANEAFLLQRSESPIEIDESKRIFVSTVHNAKGLEFRAVHFCACDALKKFPNQRNMTYTAITRAKTALSIYHCGQLPGFFENALLPFRAPKKPTGIADLFTPPGED